MTRTFSITVPPESRTLHADEQGRAAVSYTITNNKPSPARGRVRVVPRNSSREDWFTIEGEPERDFRGDEAHQFTVRAIMSPDAPAGTYSFRLDAANVSNPQEDFTEGETVAIEWRPSPQKRAAAWPWPLIAAGGALFIVAAIALFFMLRPIRVPDVLGKTLPFALADIQSAQLTPIEPWLYEYALNPAEDSDNPANWIVVRTEPPAHTKVDRNSNVQLVVLRKGLEVPPVEGKKVEEALALLKDGFQVADVNHSGQRENTAPGIVIEQIPQGGKVVPPGSEVKLVVQKPADRPQVPPVLGKKYDVAELLLSQAGIGYTREIVSSQSPGWIRSREVPGTVVAVEPAEGMEVPEATGQVKLVVMGIAVPNFESKRPIRERPGTPAPAVMARILTVEQYKDLLVKSGLLYKTSAPGSDKVKRTHPQPGTALLPGPQAVVEINYPLVKLPADSFRTLPFDKHGS